MLGIIRCRIFFFQVAIPKFKDIELKICLLFCMGVKLGR